MQTMNKLTRSGVALLLAASLNSALSADPATDAELQTLREQVHQLQQQLAALSHRIEAKETSAAAAPTPAAAPTAVVTAGEKGFQLASADNAFSIRFRAVGQVDSRFFFGDGGAVANDSFLLRRARIITEGNLGRGFSFVFVPEFGGSSVSILDAAIGVSLNDSLQLKFGKFTPPLGLERLQGVSWTYFNESSLASNLLPSRDIGLQASGTLASGTLTYAAGVFGGVADNGSSPNSDFDNDKDLIARLYATPFKNSEGSALRGLSVGVAGSLGRAKTASGRSAAYRTDGQQVFFKYADATVADGCNWRLTPQFDYRVGSFGLAGEYVVSSTELRSGAATATLANRAWQVSAGYVLTGEASSFSGVKPRNTFNLADGTWGAFELVGRVSGFRVDDDAFPLFASVGSNASEATAYGVGFNWYLSRNLKFSTDFYVTDFGFADSAPASSSSAILRQDEQALISRLQVAF